jgi:hypothetical protein
VYRFYLFTHPWGAGEFEENQIQKELAKHHEVHTGPWRGKIHCAHDHNKRQSYAEKTGVE